MHMDQPSISRSFLKAKQLATGTKLFRLGAAPLKYLIGVGYTKLIYPILHKPLSAVAHTFFGKRLNVDLPAGLDIYLTGTKTHTSELRLIQFLLAELKPGMTFIDVGAHVGFFAFLAQQLVGENGQVLAFEPTPRTFELLTTNCRKSQVEPVQAVVSDRDDASVSFYSFPTHQSEYNTIHAQQFEGKHWAKKRVEHQLPSIRLDKWLLTRTLLPDFIKIDVEGAEWQVIKGLALLLDQKKPVIIMEYVFSDLLVPEYDKAINWLVGKGYVLFLINEEGMLVKGQIKDLQGKKDSENVVLVPNDS